MTTSMFDTQWTADPTQPGRIAAGDFILIDVRVSFWRVPGGDSEAMRLVNETEALVLAAPAMAKALLTQVEGCFICHGTGRSKEAVSPPELVRDAPCRACATDRAALALAGVRLP